MTQIAINL